MQLSARISRLISALWKSCRQSLPASFSSLRAVATILQVRGTGSMARSLGVGAHACHELSQLLSRIGGLYHLRGPSQPMISTVE